MRVGRSDKRAGPARRMEKRRDRQRAREAAILEHRRRQPLTARLFGDPLPGRSALDRVAERAKDEITQIIVKVGDTGSEPFAAADISDGLEALHDLGFGHDGT